MNVMECDLPPSSVLDRRVVDSAYFRDSYRAPLRNPGQDMGDIFFAIFGHHPVWMTALLIARNWIASRCGLDVPAASDIMNASRKEHFKVGDTIGPWPIFSLTDTELVAGRDNRHLDFRLSLLRITHDEVSSIVVSTICSVHNWSGKTYLFFIVPFHKWGVKRLISRAIIAGRL
jgi:hypothetical protein